MATEVTDNEVSADDLSPRLAKLGERTPADVERQVMLINTGSSLDDLSAAIDLTEWLLCRARTIDRLMKALAIQWIDQHGEFDIGPMHYSASYSTTVKCRDTLQAAHAILSAAGGDFDQFLKALIAQPYKHGTVRGMMDKAVYASLFSVHRTARLVNGIPERTLKKADLRYVPS